MDKTRPGPWRVYFCSDAQQVIELERSRPDLGEGRYEIQVIPFAVLITLLFPGQT